MNLPHVYHISTKPESCKSVCGKHFDYDVFLLSKEEFLGMPVEQCCKKCDESIKESHTVIPEYRQDIKKGENKC